MNRSVTLPDSALGAMLRNQMKALEDLERRAMWPGATQVATYDGPTATLFGQFPIAEPGYPELAMTTFVSMNLEAGRWVVMYEASVAAAGSDTAILGLSAEVSSVTKRQQRYVANFPFPRDDYPSSFRIASQVIVPDGFTTQARIRIWTGGSSFPGVPEVDGFIYSASILAIPG